MFPTSKVLAKFLIIVLIGAPCRLFGEQERQERVDSVEDLYGGFLRDGAYIATFPLRLNKKGALTFVGACGIVYGITRFDRKFSNNIQRQRRRGLKKIFKDLGEDEGIEALGRSSGSLLTSLGFYGGGVIFNSQRAKRVGFIGMESWFYVDTITKLLKVTFGRSRPGGANDPYVFNPFHGGSSMPSGHTSTAFCLASVIATEYNSVLIDVASYGTATMVGFSRLYRNVHWTSDVVASAFLGIAIGKTTHWLYRKDPRNWEIVFDGDKLIWRRRF